VKPETPRPLLLTYDLGDGQMNPADAPPDADGLPLPRASAEPCDPKLEGNRLAAMLRRCVVRLHPWVRGPEGNRSGSGVVIAPSGQILTAAHVARVARSWQVEWANGTKMLADVKEIEEGSDISRLELRNEKLERFAYLRVARRGYYKQLNLEGRPVLAAGFSTERGEFHLAVCCSRIAKVALWRELQNLTGDRGNWDPQAPVSVFSGDTPLGFSGGPVVDPNGVVIALSCYRTKESKQAVATVFLGNRPADFLEKIGLR
jgi:S1-C subfamily serine protease